MAFANRNTGNRRALLIGLDNYFQSPLLGCELDARKLQGLLSKHFDLFPNFECKMLLAPLGEKARLESRKEMIFIDSVTTDLMMKEINDLFSQKAEYAVLHFSGHGFINEFGGFLVSQNSKRYDSGVRMNEVMSVIENARSKNIVREVLVILDCCHSGQFGSISDLNPQIAKIPEGVTVIGACQYFEAAAGDSKGGFLSKGVCNALHGGGADPLGNVTAFSIYGHLSGSLASTLNNQNFIFRSNVTSNYSPVRFCQPELEFSILKIIPKIFGEIDFEFPLTQDLIIKDRNGYERYEDVVGHILQMMRLGIVEIIGEDDIIYAAKTGCSCRLTPLGQYFWNELQRN